MQQKIDQNFKDKRTDMTYTIEQLKDLSSKVTINYPFQDVTTPYLTKINGEKEQWKKYDITLILSQYNPNHYIGKKYHDIEIMYVSDMGRVKVKYKTNISPNEEILAQSDDIEGGYLRLPKFPGFGNVYRLVAETWLEEVKDKNIVHHINNNGYDNRVENLIWVNKEEHGLIHGFKI